MSKSLAVKEIENMIIEAAQAGIKGVELVVEVAVKVKELR